MKREGEFGEGEFNRYLETFEANLSATGHQEMRNDSMQYALERINNVNISSIYLSIYYIYIYI